MTEPDFGTFERAFGRVCGAYRLKLKPSEADDLARTYFRVLEAYPLDDVLLAGKKCIAKHRAFPKAVDWITELATAETAAAGGTTERHMGVTELDELARAERLRFVDQPCLCSDCCRAGIDERPIRFVPTLFGDVEERAYNPRRKVVQVVGHWAHGEELRRWYTARDAFFALAPAGIVRLLSTGRAKSFQARLDEIFEKREREPGEDG